MKRFNYENEKMYLITRSRYEGYLIQQFDNGTDIAKVQPRELIIEKKKMGEFQSLTVSARGLAEPGTYGELYPGNQVYEVEFRDDMSYRLRPRTFVPAGFGLAATIPVIVDKEFRQFDMLAAEFILREKLGDEYGVLRDAVEKVYDAVISNPCIKAGGQSPEEMIVSQVLSGSAAEAVA